MRIGRFFLRSSAFICGLCPARLNGRQNGLALVPEFRAEHDEDDGGERRARAPVVIHEIECSGFAKLG